MFALERVNEKLWNGSPQYNKLFSCLCIYTSSATKSMEISTHKTNSSNRMYISTVQKNSFHISEKSSNWKLCVKLKGISPTQISKMEILCTRNFWRSNTPRPELVIQVLYHTPYSHYFVESFFSSIALLKKCKKKIRLKYGTEDLYKKKLFLLLTVRWENEINRRKKKLL